LVGKFNHSESESSIGSFYDGGFTEAVLGYAYRPIAHDRLNALVKYTYFYNMPTTGQVSTQNVAAEFVQKSHIAALDVSYDFTTWLTIGSKYAYRQSQVSLDREDPVFFANDASLYVLRSDIRFWENWELLIEGRLLDMTDLGEHRAGALTGLSRYIGDHLKNRPGLQLHRLLGRSHGSELRKSGILPQPQRILIVVTDFRYNGRQ
jgi:hypothetical protein